MPRKTKGVAVETTAIVLRIAADHATDFEAMFDAEEIPIWDDFMRRGRFLEDHLVRAIGGGRSLGGLLDFLLSMAAAGYEGRPVHYPDSPMSAVPAKRAPAPTAPAPGEF